MWRRIRRGLKSRRIAPLDGGESEAGVDTDGGSSPNLAVEPAADRSRGCLAMLRRRRAKTLQTIVEERSSEILNLTRTPVVRSRLQSILRFPLKFSSAKTDLRRLATSDDAPSSNIDSLAGQPDVADVDLTTEQAEAANTEAEAEDAVGIGLKRVDASQALHTAGSNESLVTIDLGQEPQTELEADTPDDRVPSLRTRIAWGKEDMIKIIPARGELELPSSSPEEERDE